MTFLLWQRQADIGIASPRRVLRAAEVPVFHQANDLCQRLQDLHDVSSDRLAAALAQAREQGHALGIEQGREAARDAADAQRVALAVSAQRDRLAVREQVAGLALQVARKLIGNLAFDQRLAALALTAAADVVPAGAIALMVHPDRVDAVQRRLTTMADGRLDGNPDGNLDVRADAACALDDCRLETEFGSVDASLETQLRRLADAWGVVNENATTPPHATSATRAAGTHGPSGSQS